MKQCPKCQASISDTAKFCMECGCNIKQYEEEHAQPRSRFCPECGTEIPRGSFCPECGYDIRSSQAAEADTFGDEWLSDINDITSATVAEAEAARLEAEEQERQRLAAEEAARREAEEQERQRKAAEEAARQEAARQEAARQAELKKRRKVLFAQKFQRDGDTIYFGNWHQSWARDVSSYGADGYCTINGKQYYRKTARWKVKKMFGYADKSETSCFEIEPIKWKILAETDEAVLVVCADIIDYRQFRSATIGNTADYINSDLRKWLNGEFLKNAFSSEEQSYIRATEINYNMDKIFIPSDQDYRKHYLRPTNTGYVNLCDVDGSYVNDYSTGSSHSWWIRSSTQATGTSVMAGWKHDGYHYSEANYREGVVPMLYIDKTKLC